MKNERKLNLKTASMRHMSLRGRLTITSRNHFEGEGVLKMISWLQRAGVENTSANT